MEYSNLIDLIIKDNKFITSTFESLDEEIRSEIENKTRALYLSTRLQGEDHVKSFKNVCLEMLEEITVYRVMMSLCFISQYIKLMKSEERDKYKDKFATELKMIMREKIPKRRTYVRYLLIPGVLLISILSGMYLFI